MMFKRPTGIIPIIISLLIISSCEDDPSDIGKNILSVNDSLKEYVHTSFQVYPVIPDSSASANYDYGLTGSYQDPVFGNSKAGFVAQFAPNTSSDITSSSHTIDSVKLYLKILDHYGSPSNQKIDVQVLDSSIANLNYSNANLSGYTSSTNIKLSATAIDFSPAGSVIKIDLTTSFASNRLFNAPAGSYPETTKQQFLDHFHGLYLFTEDNYTANGSITRIDLFDAETRLEVYYDSTELVQYTILPDYCKRLNLFEHDYSVSPFNAYINDSTYNDSLCWIQSMNGVETIIKIEDLALIQNKGVINKAELIIPVQVDNTYPPPERLVMLTYDENGNEKILSDDAFFTSLNYYGGEYNAGFYTFNISNHIQTLSLGNNHLSRLRVFTGAYLTDDNILYYNAQVFNRVVIKTGTHPTDGIKLKLLYTKLND
jgi:hypothetical protein